VTSLLTLLRDFIATKARIIKAYVNKMSSLSLAQTRKRYLKPNSTSVYSLTWDCVRAFGFKLSTRGIFNFFWEQQLEKAWNFRVCQWQTENRLQSFAIAINKSERFFPMHALVVTFGWFTKKKISRLHLQAGLLVLLFSSKAEICSWNTILRVN